MLLYIYIYTHSFYNILHAIAVYTIVSYNIDLYYIILYYILYSIIRYSTILYCIAEALCAETGGLWWRSFGFASGWHEKVIIIMIMIYHYTLPRLFISDTCIYYSDYYSCRYNSDDYYMQVIIIIYHYGY